MIVDSTGALALPKVPQHLVVIGGGVIGLGTEELAERAGPALGGFLNATFGNAAELIIALVALQNGLYDVVKASLTGSIIGNILLVLGVSMVAGGWNRERQKFDRAAAAASATLLSLAALALVVPAAFHFCMCRCFAAENARPRTHTAITLPASAACSLQP